MLGVEHRNKLIQLQSMAPTQWLYIREPLQATHVSSALLLDLSQAIDCQSSYFVCLTDFRIAARPHGDVSRGPHVRANIPQDSGFLTKLVNAHRRAAAAACKAHTEAAKSRRVHSVAHSSAALTEGSLVVRHPPQARRREAALQRCLQPPWRSSCCSNPHQAMRSSRSPRPTSSARPPTRYK